ncbi:hypothetical protein ABK046_51545, partial [Streptomyces caeruleatus]
KAVENATVHHLATRPEAADARPWLFGIATNLIGRHPAVEWRGRGDGSYTVRTLPASAPVSGVVGVRRQGGRVVVGRGER